MRMTILYYSRGGTTKRMAECIAEGMRSAGEVEVRTFPLDAIEADFLKDSRCVVLGTPTYVANMAGAVKTWLDESPLRPTLAGKIGGAFATADYLHGGADLAVQTIISHLMVLGMLAYSGGASYGKPVIHLGPVALKENAADYEDVFRLYGKRMATKALEVFR